MEQLIILQGITVEQLLTCINAVIEKKITKKLQEMQTPKPFRYMTRKEVAKYLHVSLPTLHEWAKMEWIKSYKIGSRVLFKSDEVNDSLKIRKFRRKIFFENFLLSLLSYFGSIHYRKQPS